MKNSGKSFDLFALLTAVGVAAAAAEGLFRPWWFDEALTLFNFILLPDGAEIYRSYFIPNNHIVYTILAHWFVRLTGSEFYLRGLSLLAGAGTLLLAWRFFRFRRGWQLMKAVLMLYAWSMGFLIYSTAIRGYMLSAFLALLFWMGLGRYRECRKIVFLAMAFAAGVLCCGVMPTNLFILGATALFAGEGKIKDTLLYGICAVLGFLVFYLPIWPSLLAASRLKESSSSTFEAILSAYIMLLPAGGFLLAGLRLPDWRKWRKFRWERVLIWLFPLLFGIFWAVAPFPRTYFPWQLLMLYILVLSARKMVLTVRKHRKIFWGVIVLWGVLWHIPAVNIAVSECAGGAWGDDYFAPYYLREEFDPAGTLYLLPEGKFQVYASFDADMWSLLYAGLGKWEIVFDGPRHKAEKLNPGDFVIIRKGEETANLEKRFGKMRKINGRGIHEILQIE